MAWLTNQASLETSKRMRYKRPTESSEAGFTIIEIMIVLAIGGLFYLIVFQAIPALARSGRNNARRQDIAKIGEAITHYELNNTANLPVSGSVSFLATQNVRLNYYNDTPAAIAITDQSLGSILPSPPPNRDTESVEIFNYEKCSTTPGIADSSGAGYADVVALYAIESGSNNTNSGESICEQL